MKLILATTAILMTATSVFAADAVYQAAAQPPEAVPQPFSWTGGYLGVQGGYGWADGSFDQAGTVFLNGDFDGGIIGAFAGANYQYQNNVVLGIEADLDYNWNEEKFDIGGSELKASGKWEGSVRARVGYAFDRALVYATAGWVAAHAEANIAGFGGDDSIVQGYTVGAGVDYALTDTVFARVDYRYNDFGSTDFNIGGTAVNADLSQHTFKVGVGFKF